MKYCSNCGNPINDDVRFCPSCGQMVSASPVQSQESVPPATPVQTQEAANGKSELYMPGLILGIVSIIGGLIIALIGWICGIIGIILSAKNLHKPGLNAMPGFVCSIIGLAVSVFNSIIGAVALVSLLENF